MKKIKTKKLTSTDYLHDYYMYDGKVKNLNKFQLLWSV